MAEMRIRIILQHICRIRPTSSALFHPHRRYANPHQEINFATRVDYHHTHTESHIPSQNASTLNKHYYTFSLVHRVRAKRTLLLLTHIFLTVKICRNSVVCTTVQLANL